MHTEIKQGAVVLIEQQELWIAAALAGIEKIYGFAGADLTRLKREDLIQHLQTMCSHGILQVKEGGFRLQPPYDGLLAAMKQSEYVVLVRPAENALPVICCYLGDRLVLAEDSGRKARELRLSSPEDDDLMRYLKETGYLPGTEMFSVREPEPWEETDTPDALPEAEPWLTVEVLRCKDGKQKARAAIVKAGLFYQLIYTEKSGRKIRPYSERALGELLLSWRNRKTK